MATLSNRLAALEKGLQKPRQNGGVVTARTGETADEAVTRAVEQGRRGSFLVVPETLQEADWAAMMQKADKEEGGT